jgi:2-methylcitrate dehydratase
MAFEDMMDKTTAHLVDFALSTTYDDLGPRVVHDCKRRLLDSIGCALGTLEDPVCRTIKELAARHSAPAEATLWGTNLRCTSEMASFANGVLVRFQDFNDTFATVDGGHPSDILSGIVAVAETWGADGKAVLTATAIGYEVFCRFMQSVPVSVQNLDQTLNVLVAVAASAGRLAGLGPEQLGHAISLAITPNLSTRQTRQGQLSHWKGCAAANATRQAIFAVLLASKGITGPSDAFEGKQGLWSIIGPREWIEPERWREMSMIGETYLKSVPVCYHAQAGAQAAIQLAPRLAGHGINAIEVATYAEGWRMIGSDPSRWNPSSRETADHSLPFVVATCLLHGRLTSESFAEEVLGEPAVRGLMAKLSVREDQQLTDKYPAAAPTRVTVHVATGETLTSEVTYPKGHPSDPMTDAELYTKFERLVGAAGGRISADGLFEAIWSLDTATDVTHLMQRVNAQQY